MAFAMASPPKQPQPRPAPRLYLVTPQVTDAAAIAPDLTAALGAADIAAVLLRLPAGDERGLINRIKDLAPLVQDRGAALLIDGHADLAARSGADGAHLSGLEEFSAALSILKPDRIAGAGGLGSRHDAMSAAEAGADYLMFGDGGRGDFAVLEERVAWSAELFELPCVAFATDTSEAELLIAAGADFIALDFVWREPDGVAAALASLASRLRLPEPAQ
jgi:thiamine-phosphate pyrophosphorylase